MTDFIPAEKATELGLTEDQLKGIAPLYENHLATQKGEWDKVANENADKIINGAIETTAKKYGVELPRNQGEKNAEYLARLNDTVVASAKTNVEQLKADYETKLKDFKGGDALQSELNAAKTKLDEALQKFADYDDLKATAGKYEPLALENAAFKKQVAWGSVKPNFPDTVNEYEAKAKYGEFIKTTEEKWNIEVVDGEAIAIDKENPHKTTKLKDLIAADASISELLQGRQQRGANGQPTGMKFEGLDFEVPANSGSAELTKAVDEYLIKKGVSKTSAQYSEQFSELYAKAKAAVNK